MAKGEKGKKMRGKMTHGRGKKAGRGAGLKGGRGRAGANKHRFLQLQVLGGKHPHLAAKPWGRTGFTSKSRSPVDTVLNVGDLARFGTTEVDLGALGYTKLLGTGDAPKGVQVRVAKATDSAMAKVKAAGGAVILAEAPQADAGDAGDSGDDE